MTSRTLRTWSLRGLFNLALGTGLFFALGTGLAFAASSYTVTDATGTVGTADSTFEIEYTLDTADQTWADGDTLTITLPDNYPVWSSWTLSVERDTDTTNDGTNENSISSGGSNGEYSVSSRVLTVKWDQTNWVAGNNFTIRVLGTAGNAPTYADSTSTFTFAGSTANGGDTNPSGTDNVDVSAGALTSANVEPDSTASGNYYTNTISFTTTTAIPTSGQIVVTYPSGYDVSGADGQTATDLSGMSGTWTASVSGQTITFTEGGSGETSAGSLSFRINNIRNPVETGDTGTYTITTKTASGTYDIDSSSSVSADAILPASGDEDEELDIPTDLTVTDAEDGEGLVLTWTDPDDTASTHVYIYRGIDPYPVNGVPIATIAVGTETYTDDDEDLEEGEVVTYQLRAANGVDRGEITDKVTYTVGGESEDADEEDTDSSDDTDDSEDDSDDEDASEDSSDSDEDTDEDGEEDEDSEDDSETELSDIDEHWAEDHIVDMVAAGIVEGNPDGTFDPEGETNRAAAAALISRVLDMGEPDAPDEDPFVDVDQDAWYAGYIAELAEISVFNGNDDGTAEPGEAVNRAEFLRLAKNAYEYVYGEQTIGYTTAAFDDLDASAWYAETATFMFREGVIEGSSCDEGNCFNADEVITRAEAAAILNRLFYGADY